MTPETLILVGLALVAVVAASVWLGHHFGMKAGQVSTPHAGWGPGIMADIQHPVRAIESEFRQGELATAEAAMSVATSGIEFILNDAGDDATIAAANARKAQRAKMRADLTAKLAGPAAA